MWAFILRKVIIYIPVYLSIILLLMGLLRVRNPVYAYLGKNASAEQKQQLLEDMGLDEPLFIDVGVWRRPWQREQGGAGGTYLRKPASYIGGYSATWQAPLEPGRYRVSMRWPNTADATSRAPVIVIDGVTRRAEIEADQRVEGIPDDPEEAAAVLGDPERLGALLAAQPPFAWHEIGEFDFESGSALVRVNNASTAEGYVLADSVRFEPVDDGGGGVTIGVGDEGFSSEGNEWTLAGFGRSFVRNQYFSFLGSVFTLDFTAESWSQKGRSVGDIIRKSIPPSMSITVPTLGASAMIGIVVALTSAYFRGRFIDRTLMTLAVLGMSISYVVYIIFGQFFGAFLPAHSPFAITGYKPWVPFLGEGATPTNWVTYCMLPVIIGVVVAVGYDTRFYRAVMVEESARDYIVTAMAKGATKRKIMFVHMLKNAMIPIITRIMATLPFLITGSVLLEMYFRIPGMGFNLIAALTASDFPVIQAFVAVLAAIFIVSIILTDVLYALVDPRVRLS